jgi:taurine--2-oxoglutarate transaminase
MQRLRSLCDEYGMLLICDEVMTGFGRTGRWFAVEHWGVIPDTLTLSKGINSGYLPLGAVMMRPQVAALFGESMLYAGLTQFGNPVFCASAIAAIEVYREERMVENSRELGEHLLSRLHELEKRHPSIGEVRGLGLFAAVELVMNRESRAPLVPWTAGFYESSHPS